MYIFGVQKKTTLGVPGEIHVQEEHAKSTLKANPVAFLAVR